MMKKARLSSLLSTDNEGKTAEDMQRASQLEQSRLSLREATTKRLQYFISFGKKISFSQWLGQTFQYQVSLLASAT